VLVSALVAHALANGIARYTGVAEIAWLQQILAFGWRCRPLGLPLGCGDALLGALVIDIDDLTPAQLAASGIHRPVVMNQLAAVLVGAPVAWAWRDFLQPAVCCNASDTTDVDAIAGRLKPGLPRHTSHGYRTRAPR
jgi:hypothetical protein